MSPGRRSGSTHEEGAVLIWVAGALVALMALAAFAVDLGWILLNRSQLQSAADSAALAGVVNLPADPGQADVDALSAARINDFPVGAVTSMSTTVLGDNSFQVDMATTVDTFFLKVIGIDTMDVTRTAVAEYIKPVRLGSPDNQFGGPSENFWAAVNGRYTETQQGDPYASQCITHASNSPGCAGATNPLYRPEGYYYAVEVAPGSTTLSVEFYDPGHYMETSGSPVRGGSSDPGDTSWRWNWPSGQRGVEIEYTLWAPDTTPNDPRDNAVALCDHTWPVVVGTNPRGTGHYNRWSGDGNCTVGGPITAGIYVLQFPSPLYEGSSKFAIRATTANGPAPKVYGLLDMSIHVNFDGGSATPYLAEVRPEHAGRTLEVDIWDLGDVNGSGQIRFLDQNGDNPACSWTSTNGQASGPTSCIIDISNQRFNAEWLRVRIPIADDYTCDPSVTDGCWWKIFIQSPGQPTDRTTWSARITGDPVRLVR